MSVHAVGFRAQPLPMIPTCFGIFTLLLLAGYAFFGRGFAYIGVPPIFVGEIGLLLAIATLLTVYVPSLWRSPITWLLVAFMLWGALRTFPYIEEYGFDALRDGVIWGYALYSLAVATIVLRFSAIDDVVSLYRRFIPIFLIVSFGVQFTQVFASEIIPRWPWSPEGSVGIIAVKPGDFAVNLCGVLTFITLGVSPTPRQPLWIIPWSMLLAPLLTGRGSFVTMFSVIFLHLLLRPSRQFIYVVLFLLTCLSVAYVTDLKIDPGNRTGERTISVEHLVESLQSIVSRSSSARLEGTKQWREMWWSRILDYTVYGDKFWTGKGFGINLADVDGFQVLEDRSLRSPHSIHMTMLARAGVPGLALWAGLQTAFGLMLWYRFLQDRKATRKALARTEAWVLLYWAAYIVNASFDVALEGPHAGIWFWSLFGFGLALIVAPRKMMTPRLATR